jgi:glucokinase
MGIAARDAAGKMQLLTGNQIGSILAWYRAAKHFEFGILNDGNRKNAAIIKTFVTTDLQKAIAEKFGIRAWALNTTMASINSGITLRTLRVFKTAAHASLQTAWAAFEVDVGQPLPCAAAIAVACPVQGEVLTFTNNPWVIEVAKIAPDLGLDHLTLLNDFEAVGHAAAQLGDQDLSQICGPEGPLPSRGVLTVIGPGTGLGVGMVVRDSAESYTVVSTEGGHVSFAPVDPVEDQILSHLRQRYPRVSAERVISGPGLAAIYTTLAAMAGEPALIGDDKALWDAALSGEDRLAAAALERFFLCFGAVEFGCGLNSG